MQKPITFLAPQPAAITGKQVKSNANSGETAPNSFKQVLSKEISENRNAVKDKPANPVENKSIPQDSKKDTSSQPTRIEPIDEDSAKEDVSQKDSDQTSGVQLIALVESLAQFSQKISEKPGVPTTGDIPAIEVTTPNAIKSDIPNNLSASASKLNQKSDPSQIIQAQLTDKTPPINSNTIDVLVDQASAKFSLGEQSLTQTSQINDLKLVKSAPTSTSVETKLPIDLKLDQFTEKKNNVIGAADVDPKIELKPDSTVVSTPDPKMALNEDFKSIVTVEPKTSLKEDLKTDLLAAPKTNPNGDLMLASSTDLKLPPSTALEADLKVNLHAEEKKDVKAELKTDLKTDLKIESKSNLKTEPKIQEIANIKEQSSKVTELTQASQNFAQQIAVSSGQINATSVVEHLAPRVGTPAWNQSVGQKIVWMVAGGQQTAELTLNPPDLGPMQVVLSVNNDQANATFISAHPDVRDALESAMPKLRQMMSDAGVQLSGFSVKSESSNAGAQFAGDRSSSRAKNNTSDTVIGSGAIAATTSTIRQSTGNGIVDTFA